MPAYRIRTSRLVLRCWSPEEVGRLQEAILESLDHLRQWMPWAMQEPEPREKKADRIRGFRAEFDAGGDRVYGILTKDEAAIVGMMGMHRRIGAGAAEIGYWIHANHVRKGYATEAAGALVRVGFEIEKLARIEIHCDPENLASAGIPRKLGLKHLVTVTGSVVTPTAEPRDEMIWALFREDYAASPAATVELEAFDATGDRLL